VPGGRTVASNAGGQRTVSGWTEQAGFVNSNTATNEVMALSRQMGYDIPAAGAMDNGVPGRFFASHAETQMAAMHPNQPIAVSREMCQQCQNWFSALARHRGQNQVVADPRWVRFFRADGTVVAIPR
jgi:hypothetical protein